MSDPHGAGLLCWDSGDNDLLDGNLPCHAKHKGNLEEAPICDSASSNDATSSPKSHTTSPVSLASPAQDNGVEEIPFWASDPPLVAFLHFPMGTQKSYAFVGYLFTQNSPNRLSHPRCKGPAVVVLPRTKNNVLEGKSNDLHLVQLVDVPPTSLSFQIVDAVPSGSN